MKEWTPQMTKAIFRRLLAHMQEVAKTKGIKTVDLTPAMFAGVVKEPYVFRISDDVLNSAVAKAVAMQKAAAVASRLSADDMTGKKRRLSEIRVD